jgi:hypothetical protein
MHHYITLTWDIIIGYWTIACLTLIQQECFDVVRKTVSKKAGCPFGVAERDWDQSKILIAKFVGEAIIDFLAIICAILVILLIFRGPNMFILMRVCLSI